MRSECWTQAAQSCSCDNSAMLQDEEEEVEVVVVMVAAAMQPDQKLQ